MSTNTIASSPQTSTIASSPHLQFRQDINGLRGVAIIIVAMAHGWKNFVSNGRPGVDVFFVISGYLISHIIFKERNNGTFTIWKFYERRIKRLVPALLFYLIFVILYLPRKFQIKTELDRIKAQGENIMSSILMMQNLQFFKMTYLNKISWTSTGHLWSLGIQEQFYIFWPLATGIILKLNTKIGSMVIISLIGLSLWSQLMIQYKYSKFLPFTTFWQLLVGALLAFIQFKGKMAAQNSKPIPSQQQGVQQQAGQPSQNTSQNNNQQQMSSNAKQNNSNLQNIQQSSFNDQLNRQKSLSQSIQTPEKVQDTIIGQLINYLQQIHPKYLEFINKAKNHPWSLALSCVRQIIPFFSMYLICWISTQRMQSLFGQIPVQHKSALSYILVTVPAAIIVLTKNSFFNRYILSTKLLLFIGDISYPFYLWHFGLMMIMKSGNIYQVNGFALFYSIISTVYIEPMFRRNQGKWVIPFLVTVQIIVFIKAYTMYTL